MRLRSIDSSTRLRAELRHYDADYAATEVWHSASHRRRRPALVLFLVVIAGIAFVKVSPLSASALLGALRPSGSGSGFAVTVEPGDVLLFHTGWGVLWDEDPARYTAGEPGVGMAVAECRLSLVLTNEKTLIFHTKNRAFKFL